MKPVTSFYMLEKKNIKKEREKGRGAHYLCMSYVRASEKALFKNKPAETSE